MYTKYKIQHSHTLKYESSNFLRNIRVKENFKLECTIFIYICTCVRCSIRCIRNDKFGTILNMLKQQLTLRIMRRHTNDKIYIRKIRKKPGDFQMKLTIRKNSPHFCINLNVILLFSIHIS